MNNRNSTKHSHCKANCCTLKCTLKVSIANFGISRKGLSGYVNNNPESSVYTYKSRVNRLFTFIRVSVGEKWKRRAPGLVLVDQHSFSLYVKLRGGPLTGFQKSTILTTAPFTLSDPRGRQRRALPGPNSFIS